MTRDDLKLKLGVVVAVIVGLATLSEGTVHALNLPLAIVPFLPWARLAAFVVGIVSAQMGKSPLPGKPADAIGAPLALLQLLFPPKASKPDGPRG